MIPNVMPPNPMVEQPASERMLLPLGQSNSPATIFSQQPASQPQGSPESPLGDAGGPTLLREAPGPAARAVAPSPDQ